MRTNESMFQTDIGLLDGDKWEGLIQSVYKSRYDTYQPMIASPGDYGIEGFVLENGVAIQCYCPQENYDGGTLHKKQKKKMTEDISKLVKYKDQIRERLGDCKISKWIFITPRVGKNDLHAVARENEKLIRESNIDICTHDFTILIHDLGNYESDIRAIQTVNGKLLSFSAFEDEIICEPIDKTDYEENIHDKNKVRSYVGGGYKEKLHLFLNSQTTEDYIGRYKILRNIYNNNPELYQRIAKSVNDFEDDVEILSMTWEGAPQELIDKIREKLMERFERDSYIKTIEYSNLESICKHMVARWIAECPMRIE
ncbi:hypothetical protein [Enterovibrio nigricans]|nr:hypothetical protein [Enterovibrio nigricans]